MSVHIDGKAAELDKMSYPEVMEACKKFAVESIPGAAKPTANEIHKDTCVVRMRVPVQTTKGDS